MRSYFRAAVVALLLLLPLHAFAQGQRGALTGSVSDPTGALVPEATITITNTDTGVVSTTRSSTAGYYRLPVSPGIYKLEAQKDGFKTAVADHIQVPVAQVVTIDFALQMGSVAEAVVVTAEAPLLTPSTSEVSNSISTVEFQTLPLPVDDGARQLMGFIYSSLPGAVGNSWAGSINGGQMFTTDILIEGLPMARYDLQGSIAELQPSADTVSEFKVQMSGYSAEYGNTGGGVANFAMKSGTNEIHGTVYEYVTNPIFNARGWGVNIQPEGSPTKMKSPIRENNYGFGIGGPIRKNKTFFYATYEGDNLRAARPSRYRTVPTLDMREGDFSALLGNEIGRDALDRPIYQDAIYNPLTTREVTAGDVDSVTGLPVVSDGLIRDAFGFDPVTGLPGPDANIIPSQYWSEASAKMLPEFANPINTKLTNNILAYTGHPVLDWTKLSGKIDHVVNDKHRMSGFFTYSHRKRLMGQGGRYFLPLPGYPLNATKIQEIPGRIFRFSEDWTINDHTLNHFAFGYNRFGNDNGQPAGDPGPWLPSVIGIEGVLDTGFPQINFSSKGQLYRAGTWGFQGFNANESFVGQDTLSYVRGKHSWKFGAEYIRYRMNDRYLGSGAGRFTFDERETGLPGGFSKRTGFPFASFILGAVDGGSRSVTTTTPGWRQALLTFYAQDDWKVTPKLTLNLGVRWDIPTPRTEAYDRISSFDPLMPNPGADGILGALAFVGDCQGCTGRNSFQDHYYREFAPRIGFAYSATQKLVIRGGYGISYSPPIMNGWIGASPGFDSSVPFGSRSLYPTQFGDRADPVLYWGPLSGASIPAGAMVGVPPFTGTLPDRSADGFNGQGVDFFPSTLAQPSVQNWNFGFQYLLPAEVMVEANYVGSKGTHLIAQALGGYFNMADNKFMALGDYVDWDMSEALADPDASAALGAVGVTALPFPSFSGVVGQGVRPYPQYESINNHFYNTGNSSYHSLQLTVRKRAGQGLNFIAAYTFSKTLTNADDVFGYYGGGPAGYWGAYATQFAHNPSLERSIASFDYPHYLKLSWIYELPFGQGKKWLNTTGAVDKILGGWKITGIHQYTSGDPLQIYNDWLWSSLGGGIVRGDVIDGVDQRVPWQGSVDPNDGTPYLNPDAFAVTPVSDSWAYALRPGTAPRLLPQTRGPGHQSEDLGLMKDTKIGERFNLNFRADFFNAFNRTGRGNPNTDVALTEDFCGCTDFGRIFGVAHGGRNIQLGLRLDF